MEKMKNLEKAENIKTEIKILHVLLSQSWGGLEHYTLDFIEQLNKNGLNSELLCKKNSKVEKEARLRNIPIHNSSFCLFQKWSHIHSHRRQDLPLVRMGLLGRKTPFFYSLYMSAPEKKDFYHRWIYSRIDALASSSELLNQEVTVNFPIDPSKIHLIRYGRPQVQQSLENLNIKPLDRILIGTMCRLDPGKGVQEIIDSLVELSLEEKMKIEIWIIGDPTLLRTNPDGTPVYEEKSLQLAERIQIESKKINSGVKLFPYQKDSQKFLASFDLFLLATHKETYSLAVIDAMLLGKPVIGTRSGGTIEQIGPSEERGFFITPQDPVSIAWALRKILQNPTLIESKGLKARQWSQHEHNWKKCLNQWSHLYKNIISSN